MEQLYLITDGEYSDYGHICLLRGKPEMDIEEMMSGWRDSDERRKARVEGGGYVSDESEKFVDYLCKKHGFKRVEFQEKHLDWWMLNDDSDIED